MKRLLLTILKPKVAIQIAIVLAMICAPFAIRIYHLSQIPYTDEPFDVEEFLALKVADADNAFVEYRLAAAKFVEPSDEVREQLEAAMENGWEAASEDVRTWVADNRDALVHFEQGSRRPDAIAVERKSLSHEWDSSVVMPLWHLSRAATMEGLRLEAAGDDEAAWRSHLAAFRASRHCGKNGDVMDRLVGIAIFHYVAPAIMRWAGKPDVTSEMLQRALKEIRSVDLLTESPSVNLKTEYCRVRNTFSKFSEFQAAIEIRHRERIPVSEKMNSYLKGDPEVSREVAKHVFANWLKYCDLPSRKRPQMNRSWPSIIYPKQLSCLFDDPAAAFDVHAWEAMNPDAFLPQVLPTVDTILESHDRDRARHALLETTMALEWYQRDHGEYPATLSQLEGRYLPAIPDDLYDPAGGPLRYRRESRGALLWSIGPDQVNNDGTPPLAGQSPEVGDLVQEIGTSE